VAAAITGQEVRAIREALGLPVMQFATILGVHPSSVHRWESGGNQAVPIEGVALTVLSALRQRVLASRAQRVRAAAAGLKVSDELATGGVLLALALLILFAAGKE
jgi:transcriptional regulator with XRE-family HTH domain